MAQFPLTHFEVESVHSSLRLTKLPRAAVKAPTPQSGVPWRKVGHLFQRIGSWVPAAPSPGANSCIADSGFQCPIHSRKT